jgi:hypothetical protein
MYHAWRRSKIHEVFYSKNHFGDIDIHGRKIILKWVIKK